jgi:Spy/CpxP family protein refolding chaperone
VEQPSKKQRLVAATPAAAAVVVVVAAARRMTDYEADVQGEWQSKKQWQEGNNKKEWDLMVVIITHD